MHKSLVILGLLVLLGLLPAAGNGAIYKWVDANGVVTFKDTPPPAGVEARTVHPDTSLVGDGGAGRAAVDRYRSNAAKAARTRAMPRVEIYMAPWCPTCKRAIAYLNSRGVSYTQYDIDQDRAANARLGDKYHQQAIPFTIIGDEKILGFSAQWFDAALGLAGR